MATTLSKELGIIGGELFDLEMAGELTFDAYQKALTRARAAGADEARCMYIHKAAARARIIKLSDIFQVVPHEMISPEPQPASTNPPRRSVAQPPTR